MHISEKELNRIECALELCLTFSSLSLSDNAKDIKFFKKCITEVYCYQKSLSADKWVTLPTYEAKFTSYFTDSAKRIERFFIRNNDWNMILESKQLRDGGSCPFLLHIIAARSRVHFNYIGSRRGCGI